MTVASAPIEYRNGNNGYVPDGEAVLTDPEGCWTDAAGYWIDAPDDSALTGCLGDDQPDDRSSP